MIERHYINSKIKSQTCAGLHSCLCAMDFMTSFSSRIGCDGSLNPAGLLGAPIGENAEQTIPSAKVGENHLINYEERGRLSSTKASSAFH